MMKTSSRGLLCVCELEHTQTLSQQPPNWKSDRKLQGNETFMKASSPSGGIRPASTPIEKMGDRAKRSAEIGSLQ
jgi:hypothetical protein